MSQPLYPLTQAKEPLLPSEEETGLAPAKDNVLHETMCASTSPERHFCSALASYSKKIQVATLKQICSRYVDMKP
jgi:hypothetical protein